MPRNIIITLPKSVKWADYQKELDKAENGEIMNFKVPFLPKEPVIGGRCYLIYDGQVRGWMEIVGIKEKGFICTTTGKKWEGNFIERSGKFNKITQYIAQKGHQGWHYLNQEYN